MPRYDKPSEITLSDGVLSGERRQSTNLSFWRKGGIHDDGASTTVGFKRGVVSAVLLNEAFFPLALRAFGKEWLERGFYSMWFRAPSYEGDYIQAFMNQPTGQTENTQVEAWSQTDDGNRIVVGTIGMGRPSEPTHLRSRFDRRNDAGEYRIMDGVEAGKPLGEVTRRFSLLTHQPMREDGINQSPLERQLDRRDDTTEPLDWYFGESPWGGPIANAVGVARITRPLTDGVPGTRTMGVVGGVEVRFLAGPIFLDRDYRVSGAVQGRSVSPKTEEIWYGTQIHEAETDKLVAETFVVARRLKAASPLYSGK